jgi:hypothetical protein
MGIMQTDRIRRASRIEVRLVGNGPGFSVSSFRPLPRGQWSRRPWSVVSGQVVSQSCGPISAFYFQRFCFSPFVPWSVVCSLAVSSQWAHGP